LNRFILPLSIFVLLVIVLAVGIKRAPQKGIIASPLIGKPAPTFELPQLGDGKPFTNASLKGQWYVLHVWGTWCPECRIEHPLLLEIKRAGAMPLIGLNWRDDDALATEWLTQLGNPFDVVPVDREGRVAIDWGVYGAPETFLVNPQGIVVHKNVGAMSREVWERDFLSHLPAEARQKAREAS
jgi:cytochrome c biogenesis protein CcmG, thiol:disulfide interchange protein DsbE